MICVAIQEKNVDTCLQILEKLELAEIRIDLCKFSQEQVHKVFSQSKAKLIATCRPDNITIDTQTALLKTAIAAGAAMIDIEIESAAEYKTEMIAYARNYSCQVIISYHNYINTPSKDELNTIIADCFTSGADIAKIAAQANTIQDSARLLSLYETDKQILILGMGQLGKITRIGAPLLGAPFTFASLDTASATAPGQIDIATLKDIYSLLK